MTNKETPEWEDRFNERFIKVDDVGIPVFNITQGSLAYIIDIIDFIRQEKELTRKEVVEELFEIKKNEWKDEIHCTCLGYAIVKISGGEDSEEGKEMEKRLLNLLTPLNKEDKK